MLKLKDIIEYLDPVNSCKIEIIWKSNESYDNDIKPEEVFEGSVLDIPWYLLEYSLYNDPHEEFNAIEVCKNEGGRVYFYITLKEN